MAEQYIGNVKTPRHRDTLRTRIVPLSASCFTGDGVVVTPERIQAVKRRLAYTIAALAVQRWKERHNTNADE